MSLTGLEALRRSDLLSWIDIHLARLMQRLADAEAEAADALSLAAALTSAATRRGHICLDLSWWAGKKIGGEEATEEPSIRCPRLEPWITLLEQSPVVGRPHQYRPLVLDDKNRLYLYRYWDYERQLIEWIKGPGLEKIPTDEILLRKRFQELLPRCDPSSIDRQMVATLAATTSRFCVISGGPGTGKTTTVAGILALALSLPQDAEPPRIALAAPTGKAASRLEESIKKGMQQAPLADVLKQPFSWQASTIHRLLGSRRHSPYFYHHEKHPLPVDLVVIDEASMVDLALMAKLVRALPAHARLILLGDKDQLASVEAGAVLGDICGDRDLDLFGCDFRRRCRAVLGVDPVSSRTQEVVSPLQDSLVELTRNYRFADDSGIGGVSRAVRQGDAQGALELFAEKRRGELARYSLPGPSEFAETLQRACLDAMRSYLQAADLDALFSAFSDHRILCALRRGPYGVEAINAFMDLFVRRYLQVSHRTHWYPRKPILITRNDYSLGLYNGDVGIAFPDPAADNAIRIHFQGPEGRWRKIHPRRLPDHELVWAMTVHKSQGSEFREVHLVLPDRDNPLLTRELIYTGITRARNRITLWADEAVFRNAVARRIERNSGLRDALWG